MNASKNNISVNQKTLKRMNNRILTTLFMGIKLPLAVIAGLRVESVSAEQGQVSLPMDGEVKTLSFYLFCSTVDGSRNEYRCLRTISL